MVVVVVVLAEDDVLAFWAADAFIPPSSTLTKGLSSDELVGIVPREDPCEIGKDPKSSKV